MAFDGVFLKQIVSRLQVLNGARINKIYQISDTEILFQLYDQKKYQLMISCHSSYNRIHLTERSYPTRTTPSNFIMVMRKYLEAGTITSVKQADLDRYLTITVTTRNELGDRINLQLYVELMGKYANIILVNDGRILEALKHIPPFENTKRTIHPGAQFKPTESQPGKLNPYEIADVDNTENLFEKLTGFSPLLSSEVSYRLHNGQSYRDIMQEISASHSIYISTVKGEELFHCLPLTHLGVEPLCMDICEGLDYIYYRKEEKERIRQITGDLFKFVRKEIKKTETKISRLQESLEEALDCDKWRQYGDALYANQDKVTKGMTTVTVTDYEDNTLTVPLNPKLDARGNARKCFQKYRKLATGQKYINEQLALAEDNLAYFNLLQNQLAQADFFTATEIRQELENNGYLKAKKAHPRGKKKETEPHYTRISFNGSDILIGKNNIQNDYLTFKKAGRNDTWFHVKDVHGAHVIINKETPDEQDIRVCAQLAAWFSKARQSGSIPVDYTLIRNLKKIPGSKIGKVIMKDYKTIYIDIDEALMKELLGE
ncbi:MAG: NFACT family protein [Erysipelotrichaceae bacterium]|nr:NFACT family protein [Erysipelotrichaceae bacterium]